MIESSGPNVEVRKSSVETSSIDVFAIILAVNTVEKNGKVENTRDRYEIWYYSLWSILAGE